MHIDRPIAIALILFTILLLVFFLVMPEYNKFKSLQSELGEKRAEYNAEHVYYNAIAETYAELQSRKDDVQKIDNALPESTDFGEVIYYLQQTAKENGLVVKNLFLSKLSSPEAQTGANNTVKDIIFSIDLSGDYPSLLGFMADLEKSARMFEINSISFGSAVKPPYSFSLQIKTYSY
jgi:Tfp pilus assembly protein PilO